MPFRIVGADHTGFTVSNLERSLAFWRDVLGFELSHNAHQKGSLAEEITGVQGAEIALAVLKSPNGHKIELLEYLAPPDRKRTDLQPCDVGFVHVALLINDLDAVLARIANSGWKAAGKAQTLEKGPNAGKRVVYVRDPDGTTIEFMELAKYELTLRLPFAGPLPQPHSRESLAKSCIDRCCASGIRYGDSGVCRDLLDRRIQRQRLPGRGGQSSQRPLARDH